MPEKQSNLMLYSQSDTQNSLKGTSCHFAGSTAFFSYTRLTSDLDHTFEFMKTRILENNYT